MIFISIYHVVRLHIIDDSKKSTNAIKTNLPVWSQSIFIWIFKIVNCIHFIDSCRSNIYIYNVRFQTIVVLGELPLKAKTLFARCEPISNGMSLGSAGSHACCTFFTERQTWHDTHSIFFSVIVIFCHCYRVSKRPTSICTVCTIFYFNSTLTFTPLFSLFSYLFFVSFLWKL